MSKASDAKPGHDLSSVPMFYSDQPAALALGPHVCRLTFGVEEDDDSQYPRPVVTVAMPTLSLMMLVNDLANTLDSATFKKDVSQALEKAAKRIASTKVGASRTPEFQPGAKKPAKNQAPA